MKNIVARFLAALLLLSTSQFSVATGPSKTAQSSCLFDEATSRTVNMFELPTNLIYEQEDYFGGYGAVYYFMDAKTEIGNGIKSGKGALIYAGNIYPLHRAKVISKARAKYSEFHSGFSVME